jgi:acetoin utilization deacetylase AcuC-like enzyme
MIGERVRKMAQICQGKLVDLIASGYNREVLPYAWLALISGLAGFELYPEEPSSMTEGARKDLTLERTEAVVAQVKHYLKDYWQCLSK